MTQEIKLGAANVWLRAFYGFTPERDGYIGFTHEADRETMFGRMQDGDLILIYGAADDLTDKDQRQQALGFLEIELERCTDHERSHPDTLAWRRSHGFEDRWTHGIKVRRAWRVNNRVHIRNIAPQAYQNKHRFERTTRAMLLTPEERALALSHTVRQVNVYGESAIAEDELGAGPIGKLLKPSRGIPPSFGDRQSTYADGENSLYLMVFSEPAEFVLGRAGDHIGHALAKIGRSNDPKRRLRELNGGFPEASVFKWKLIQTHKLPDGETAHTLEDELKALFDGRFQSQRGEFFTGPSGELQSAFHEFSCANKPIIRGASGVAKGTRR